VFFETPLQSIDRVNALGYSQALHLPVNTDSYYESGLKVDEKCHTQFASLPKATFEVEEKKAISYFITRSSTTSATGQIQLYRMPSIDNLEKDKDGSPKIRIFYGSSSKDAIEVSLKGSGSATTIAVTPNTATDFIVVETGSFEVVVNNTKVVMIVMTVELYPGSISVILLNEIADGLNGSIVEIVKGNDLHILWQLPQIILISAGEIMFSVTGLEFSFTQAPESMKSVLSAAWLLTVAFGNLIVVVISEMHFFESQAYEFLLFAGLMFVDMAIFAVMAMMYKYVQPASSRASIDAATSQVPKLEMATSSS